MSEQNKVNGQSKMSGQSKVREKVLRALMLILEDKRPSHLVIRETLADCREFDRRDRAFFTRLCEGTVEQLIRLDYVLGVCSSVPTRKMKPFIRTLLRMSVYQLLFMDSVPDSAVCSEAVRLTQKRGFTGLKGYVNGVLRGVCRLEPEKTLPPSDQDMEKFLSVKYSVPVWLVHYLRKQEGEERTNRILEGFLEERPLTVRINLSRVSREAVISGLERQSTHVSSLGEGFPEALALKNTGNLMELDAMKNGLIQVQDMASMLPVFAAGIQKGDFIVDVCAAPGGKTLHAADILSGSGKILSRDISPEKAELIRENVQRNRLPGIETEVWDASVFDPSLENKADVVIADLPCSGLGIIGKKPDIKYRMDEKQICELAALQRKILSVVCRYVRPGGRLVFSTCTLTREENLDNRDWFLAHFPEFSPFPPDDGHFRQFPEASVRSGYLQLLPGIHPCDGFFLAAFIRKTEKI